MKALGNRIRQQREKRRLRQADIAAALCVSAQAVSKWERGENAPDIALLVPLCKLLGVQAEWLLSGNEEDRDTFEATVICSGLNGFAKRSASLPPREVALWANGIYYSLTEAVLGESGIPVKYVGDGFLAFFSGTDHAVRGVRAARAALAAVSDKNLVIMLHTGPVFLGTIGHPDYAAPDIIGDTVNAAFLALQQVSSKNGGAWMTSATWDGVVSSEDDSNRRIASITSDKYMEKIQLSGESKPVEIFQIKV